MERNAKRFSDMINWLKPLWGRALVVGGSLIQWALGALFIYSGVEKIWHPQVFLATVYDFRLTGPLLGLFIAILIPWLELLIGLALISGVFLGGMLLLASTLSFFFLLVQASAIMRGLSITCGCFGPDEAHMVGKVTFIRTFIVFSSALVAFGGHYRRCVPRSPRHHGGPDDRVPLIGLRQHSTKTVEIGCTLLLDRSEHEVHF